MNGIGIDIVEIDRINKALSDTFVSKVLSKEEIITFNKYKNKRKIEYLAGRWACKEAIIKCLSDYEAPLMTDLNITNNENGKPEIKYKNYDIKLSISHEEHYAVAIAYLNKIGGN